MNVERSALITGASRGIGASIAERLAKDGWNVAVTYRDRESEAQEVARGLESCGVKARALQADAHESDSVTDCVRSVVEDFGQLDLLVNNIGKISDGMAVGMRGEFEDVIVTNLKSTFLFTHAVLPHMMRRRSGRIINITSMVGRNPGGVGQANYVASKAAIHAFTRSVAQEVAARGITVNSVAPGLVDTELSKAVLQAKPGIVRAIPARRLAEKAEVASMVAYLASDEAAYVTGEVIGVTGGMCL